MEGGIELSSATTEDMIGELERRGWRVTLVLYPAYGERRRPAELRPEEPAAYRLHADSWHSKNPMLEAEMLWCGIQERLDELVYDFDDRLDPSLVVEVSHHVTQVKHQLEKLFKQSWS